MGQRGARNTGVRGRIVWCPSDFRLLTGRQLVPLVQEVFIRGAGGNSHQNPSSWQFNRQSAEKPYLLTRFPSLVNQDWEWFKRTLSRLSGSLW